MRQRGRHANEGVMQRGRHASEGVNTTRASCDIVLPIKSIHEHFFKTHLLLEERVFRILSAFALGSGVV